MVTILRVLRILFAVIGIWQIIGLVPVITWFAHPNAVTLGMAGIVIFKIFVALICAAIYYWLHRVQQRHQLTESSIQPIQLGPIKLATPPVRNDAEKILSPATDGSPIMKDKTSTTSTAGGTDDIYAKIADELSSGAVDTGLWTRLFVESDGDERQTKVRYIKARAIILAARQREENACNGQDATIAQARTANIEASRKRLLELCGRLREKTLDYDQYQQLAAATEASLGLTNGTIFASYVVTRGGSKTIIKRFDELRPWFIENIVPQVEGDL